MLNIIKNVIRILSKRKSFLFVTFVLPILVVLLFTSTFTQSSTATIAVINNDKGGFGEFIVNRLNDVDGVETIEVTDEDNIEEGLLFAKYQMAITIDKDYTEDMLNGKLNKIRTKTVRKEEIQALVSRIIENNSSSLLKVCSNIDAKAIGEDKILDSLINNEPKLTVNKLSKEKKSINDALGMMLYIITLTATMSVSYLLEDEDLGTKDRILMSNVSVKTYYSSMSIIFFVLSSVPAIEYYILCKVKKLEFGFKHTYIMLLLLLLGVLIIVMLNIFLTTFIKKRQVVSLISSTCLLPIYMLSGAFWPYEYMSKTLQKIGSFLPPRWILGSIEKLQQGKYIKEILPEISGLILVSIILFLATIIFTKNKIVLVKNKK